MGVGVDIRCAEVLRAEKCHKNENPCGSAKYSYHREFSMTKLGLQICVRRTLGSSYQIRKKLRLRGGNAVENGFCSGEI